MSRQTVAAFDPKPSRAPARRPESEHPAHRRPVVISLEPSAAPAARAAVLSGGKLATALESVCAATILDPENVAGLRDFPGLPAAERMPLPWRHVPELRQTLSSIDRASSSEIESLLTRAGRADTLSAVRSIDAATVPAADSVERALAALGRERHAERIGREMEWLRTPFAGSVHAGAAALAQSVNADANANNAHDNSSFSANNSIFTASSSNNNRVSMGTPLRAYGPAMGGNDHAFTPSSHSNGHSGHGHGHGPTLSSSSSSSNSSVSRAGAQAHASGIESATAAASARAAAAVERFLANNDTRNNSNIGNATVSYNAGAQAGSATGAAAVRASSVYAALEARLNFDAA